MNKSILWTLIVVTLSSISTVFNCANACNCRCTSTWYTHPAVQKSNLQACTTYCKNTYNDEVYNGGGKNDCANENQ